MSRSITFGYNMFQGGDKCEILRLHCGYSYSHQRSLQTKTPGISAQIGTFIELEANWRAKPSLPLQNLECTKMFIQREGHT